MPTARPISDLILIPGRTHKRLHRARGDRSLRLLDLSMSLPARGTVDRLLRARRALRHRHHDVNPLGPSLISGQHIAHKFEGPIVNHSPCAALEPGTAIREFLPNELSRGF